MFDSHDFFFPFDDLCNIDDDGGETSDSLGIVGKLSSGDSFLRDFLKMKKYKNY
jgi:hypothetical protein